MKSNTINPLILSGKNIKDPLLNTITNETILSQLANQNLPILSPITNFDQNTISGINIGLNSILQETPLKLGCCMRNQNDNTARVVNVRVELEPNAIGTAKTNGFDFKTMQIPANTCPKNLYKGSPYCDTYYDIYCSNVNNVFSEQFGIQIGDSTNKYPLYAPECACYAPITSDQKSYPSGIPYACYKSGCAVDGSASYPDPTSRNQPCDATICSSIVNASELQVKGNTTINPTIIQECGSTSVSNKKVNIENISNMPTILNSTVVEQIKTNQSGILISCIIYCICIISICLLYFFVFHKNNTDSHSSNVHPIYSPYGRHRRY